MFYVVEKYAIVDPAKVAKRMVMVLAQNTFGPYSKNFTVKIGISCSINTFTPDPSDMVDPVTRFSKVY
jgi:hypothetical protein